MSFFSKAVYYCSSILLNRLFSLLPLRRNQVLFLSDVRSELGDNFSPVYEKLGREYNKVTSLKADRRLRRSFTQWLKECYYIATSGCIFLDDFTSSTSFIRVRNGQQLVQLWHGSGAYKKFGYSRAGNDGDIRHVNPGYRKYTLAIVSSEQVRPCFAEAFSLPLDRVAATGVPRTDRFFDEDYLRDCKIRLSKMCPEISGRKVILYAPTYRGDKVEDASYDFSKFDLESAFQALHDDYVIIFKWHPALYNNIALNKIQAYDLSHYHGFAWDFSEYRDIDGLLAACDILITDYSSMIFDYALLDKPLILYPYDQKEYEDGRGLYFDFQDYVYGSVATSTPEIIDQIRRESIDENKRAAFIRRFVSANDGNASDRIIERVFH